MIERTKKVFLSFPISFPLVFSLLFPLLLFQSILSSHFTYLLFPFHTPSVFAAETVNNGDDKAFSLPLDLKTTQLEDIKSWQSLGNNYVAGKNEKNEVLAIYDLGMENPLSLISFKRRMIGSLSIGDLQIKKVITLIKEIIKTRAQLQDNLPESFFQSLGIVGKKMGKSEGEFNVKTYQQLVSVLDNWDNQYGAQNLSQPLPERWWQQVEWNNQSFHLEETGPERFKISDLNLPKMAKNSLSLKLVLKDLHRKLAKIYQLPTSEISGSSEEMNIFESFEFVKNENGYYDIYFGSENHDGSVSVKDLHKGLINRPNFDPYHLTPLIDVAHNNPSILRPLGEKIIQKALDALINLIPNKIVSTLVKYPIERWMSLHQQLMTSHRLAALESFNLVETGSELSYFASLDAGTREKAVLYILRQEMDVLKRIFSGPSIESWKKGINNDVEKSRSSLEWLKNNQQVSDGNLSEEIFTTLNPWFVLHEGKLNSVLPKKLYILTETYPMTKAPFVAIDYNHPERERIKRNAAEMLSFAMRFIEIPIPFVGNILGKIYSYFVTDPIGKSKLWESRLRSTLRYKQEKMDENWHAEIDYLLDLQLNPFELENREEKEMIVKRRQMLKLEN